ncbi:hypothetical protein [Parvibaculum sp.]|jgi:hypothetical protein|nr:hypothetical protein [Parvibaculum sp.]HUD53172.1 hypothetical protein [Parvibaculum sp.]
MNLTNKAQRAESLATRFIVVLLAAYTLTLIAQTAGVVHIA